MRRHVHRGLRTIPLVALTAFALGSSAIRSAPEITAEWTTIEYGSLVDRRELSHSGESVGALLNRLDGRPVPPPGERPADRTAHALLDPLLEPYAFVLSDALDSQQTVPDPPLVEIGSLWHPGEVQPAWVELLRARHLIVESDGAGRMRLFLPMDQQPSGSADAARSAYEAAWPVLRHVFAAERKRLESSGQTAPLAVAVHAFNHTPARTRFTLGLEAYRVEVDDTRSDGRRPPLDLDGLRSFLESGWQLEGARLEVDGSLRLLGSRPDSMPSVLGRPLELSDFAVAYRTVFHGGLAEPYMSLDRGFSPQTSVVNYGGRLRDTALGLVSLLCDIRFKTFSQGIDILDGEDVRERVRENVPGFLTHLERFAADERSEEVVGQQTRLWFYPDNVDLTLSPQSDVLVMRRVRMSAASERVADPAMTASATAEDPPWTTATVAAINADYAGFARVFPELAGLDQVVRLLSFFTWLRQAELAGLALPDLDILLAEELPRLYTPRTFPQLLAFNALPQARTEGPVLVFDRVPVGDALDRLQPRGGRSLPARSRFDRAVSALDRQDAQEAALFDELAGYEVDALSPGDLDLLAYRAERLRMHRLVLSTLERERAARLVARQMDGETLRVFSVGIGGLDLGMGQALARAGGRSMRLALGSSVGGASGSAPRAMPASSTQARRPAEPRESWRSESPSRPRSPIPDHRATRGASGRFADLSVETGVAEEEGPDGKVIRRPWIWTLLAADSPEARSRKVFLSASGRAARVERVEHGRLIAYRFEGDGDARRAVREGPLGPEPPPEDRSEPPLPGLVRVRVAGSQVPNAPTVRVGLEFDQGGAPRQMEADFPRPVLQRLVLGRGVDTTPAAPLPLAPLPPSLGEVQTVMFQLGPAQRARPWLWFSAPMPGEEDGARLARALNVWSREGPPEQGAAPAVVGTDPSRSASRWNRAPRPGGNGVLLLPAEGFSARSQALRDALAAAWDAGPVVGALPDRIESNLLIMISDEPPGSCASRLRELSAAPALQGKLLAAWCLAGDLRPDVPAALLRQGGVAALGLGRSSIVDLRRTSDELAEFAAALRSPLNADVRVEQLGGPFLWNF